VPGESIMSTMDQRTVLLVSDDGDFVRQLSDRWQKERVVPAFVVAADSEAFGANFDLAICTFHVGTDALVCLAERSSAAHGNHEQVTSRLHEIENTGRPVIALAKDQQTLDRLRRDFPRVLAVALHASWPDTLVSLAMEILRRTEAVKRAERAEQLNLVLQRHATLGQYMIDMRHSLNNALTSVLGNAELLLLEPGAFSAGVRGQLDTIRHMSLRMHEILQRFSSLEKELSFAETRAENCPRPTQVVSRNEVAALTGS